MSVIEILKQHNIKKTPGRIAIIKSLQESKRPLCESEIKADMQENYDRITFYRNVHTLSQAGVIHKIVIDNTTILYALNHCEEHHQHETLHPHFYCEICHKVVCLEDVKKPEFPLPSGYTFSESEIVIKGKCKTCNK